MKNIKLVILKFIFQDYIKLILKWYLQHTSFNEKKLNVVQRSNY